jgi:cilia- and flagella-associated protein 251
MTPAVMQAMTATEDGDVIVWEQQGVSTQLGTKSTDRKAAKLVHLHNSAITVLHTVGTYIMTAAEDGYVRFYDSVLRLCAWFEDVDAGGIVSASFAVTTKIFRNTEDSALNRCGI